MIPSVSAISLNECPDADARTASPRAAALRTTTESSSRLRGRSIAIGAQRWSPAQLRHSAIARSVFQRRCRQTWVRLPGGVAERLNAAALKAVDRVRSVRGFESHPLR